MHLRNYLALTAVFFLSACGFQLRGAYHFPFSNLYIAGAPARVEGDIKRMIEGGSNAKVVADPRQADAILQIAEQKSQGVLTLNQYGSVEEYSVTYLMQYSLQSSKGVVLIAPSQIQLNRAMTYSDQYALAKAQESEILYQDMQNQAVNQLLFRLSSVKNYLDKGQALPAITQSVPLPPPPL